MPDARPASSDTATAAEPDPFTFARRCVPNVVRLPVHADIEPGRSPNGGNHLEFLRPLCIVTNGTRTCRVRPDVLIVADSRGAFHGEGVAVLSLMMTYADGLNVSLDRWDESTTLADAAVFSEGMATLEDCCVKIPWSSDGAGTLKAVRGKLTRTGAKGPWMFEPFPRVCAANHRPGDDHVWDAPLPASGKAITAIPTGGLAEVFVTGTLRPTQTSAVFDPHTFSVVVDASYTMTWRRP